MAVFLAIPAAIKVAPAAATGLKAGTTAVSGFLARRAAAKAVTNVATQTAARSTASGFLGKSAGYLWNRKLSWGGVITVGAVSKFGVPAAAALDNAMGNPVGNWALDSLESDGLRGKVANAALRMTQGILAVSETIDNEIATAVANPVIRSLERRGTLDPDDPNYEMHRNMVYAGALAVTVSPIRATMSLNENTNIERSEILGAHNKARSENPGATDVELAEATFVNLRQYIESRQAQNDAENEQSVSLTDSFSEHRQQAEHTAQKLREVSRIDSLHGEGLSAEFNRVVQENNLGMFSNVKMFFATVFSKLGNIGGLGDHFKRAVVMDATISQFGDEFDMAGVANRVRPDLDRTADHLAPTPSAG